MCGRFLFTSPIDAMRALFKVPSRLNIAPRYNIAPTQDILVVSEQAEVGLCFAPMRWGMVPSWIKEMPRSCVFNARAETIHEKPFFRGAYRHHRCLIPANGWYEWANLDGEKRPYVMALDDQAPFAFAGVSDLWTGPDGESYLLSAAIVTRPAIGHLETVHDRMPLALSAEGMQRWMDHKDYHPPNPLDQDLLRTPESFKIRPVSKALGNVRNEGADLLVPD